LKQEDFDYMLEKGILDENQALIAFELFAERMMKQDAFYTIKKDFYVLNSFPLVYSLAVLYTSLLICISMVHKYYTLRYSAFLYIVCKLLECVNFYYVSLYFEKQGCQLMATVVHTIFSVTVYNLFLNILQYLDYD